MVNATKWKPPTTPTPKLLDSRQAAAKSALFILAIIAARQRWMAVPAPIGWYCRILLSSRGHCLNKSVNQTAKNLLNKSLGLSLYKAGGTLFNKSLRAP
eukprot:5602353-Ditylum_brightwellii.AAC.1